MGGAYKSALGKPGIALEILSQIFPRELMNRFPLLPLEEGRLNDVSLRENFIERVLPVVKGDRDYYRWTEMLDQEPTPGGLVPVPAVRADKFHRAHKLTLTAHSPKLYTEMGHLVADAGKRDWEELTGEYGAQLMEGLGVMGCKRSGRGQACERAPALDGLPQEPSLQ